MKRAEIRNLSGMKKKHYESAIEIMYLSNSITVGGDSIPRDEVRKRLENISYEHIVYVENNMPCKFVDGKTRSLVRNPVSYIVCALFHALRYTEREIVESEYGFSTL